MTPRQHELIRATWADVAPIADTAARLFYDRLFELDPSVARMFAATDMAAQRKVLMQTLAVVVKSIDALDTILPAVEAMGRRHVGYGVQPRHYATVGQALLDTLGMGLGERFTPEAREAWTEAFEVLAATMMCATPAERAA